MNVLLVFVGGGTGAILRYLINIHNVTYSNINGFPLTTFMVNVIGCFAIGVLSALAIKFRLSEQVTLLLMTGLLGGFTTFSSFGLEFLQLMKNNQMQMAFLYVVMTNFVGLGICALGFHLIK